MLIVKGDFAVISNKTSERAVSLDMDRWGWRGLEVMDVGIGGPFLPCLLWLACRIGKKASLGGEKGKKKREKMLHIGKKM